MLISESQLRHLIRHKIVENYKLTLLKEDSLTDNEKNENPFKNVEDFEGQTPPDDAILGILGIKANQIINNKDAIKGIKKVYDDFKGNEGSGKWLWNSLTSWTGDKEKPDPDKVNAFMGFGWKIKINEFLRDKYGFNKIGPSGFKELSKNYMLFPIKNFKEYVSFLKTQKKFDKSMEIPEKFISPEFESGWLLYDIAKKEFNKIMITLNTEQAEVLRNIIDQNMQSEDTGISQYTSNLTGDEDWVDYLEGDEGSILNAATLLTPGVSSLTKKVTNKITDNIAKKAVQGINSPAFGQSLTGSIGDDLARYSKPVVRSIDDDVAKYSKTVATEQSKSQIKRVGITKPNKFKISEPVKKAFKKQNKSTDTSTYTSGFLKNQNNYNAIKKASQNNFTNIEKHQKTFDTLRKTFKDNEKSTLTTALKSKPSARNPAQKEIIKKANRQLKRFKSPLKLELKLNKNKNLLNEFAFIPFLIPVIKFVLVSAFWGAMYHFFDKNLRTEDSNWIEHRKLYVFDIDEEIYQEVPDHIEYLENVLSVGESSADVGDKEGDESTENEKNQYQVSNEFKEAIKKLNSDATLQSLFKVLSNFILPDFPKGHVQFAGALQNKDSLHLLKSKNFGFVDATDEQLSQIAAIFKEIFIGASPNTGSVLEDALNELNIDDLVENETIDFTNLNIQNLGKFGKQINQKVTLKNLLLSRFKKLQQKT